MPPSSADDTHPIPVSSAAASFGLGPDSLAREWPAEAVGVHARSLARSYARFVVAATLLVCALVVWQTIDVELAFRDSQTQLANHAVRSAAKQIAIQVSELRRTVEVVAVREQRLFHELLQDPRSTSAFDQVERLVHRHFPEHVAFAYANGAGEVIVEDIDGTVGEACRAEIRQFSTAEEPHFAYLHPEPGAPHFDIMARVDLPSGAHGVFFVSFSPDVLARLLQFSEFPGHALLLLRRDDPGLVDVSSLGPRSTPGTPPRIAPADVAQAQAVMPVEHTRWQVVAIPKPGTLQAHRLKNWGTAAALGGAVLLVGAMMLLFLRREETKRDSEVQRRRDADARFAALLDTSDQAILSFDDTQRIVTFNRGAQRIFGWTEVDALGQPIQRLFGWPLERSVFHDDGLRVGQVRELYGLRHDGESFPALAWTSSYRRGNRHVWTTIVEDVTLRRQLELENQRLAAFPKENPNPVVALEADGELIYANPAAERLQESMGLDSVLQLLPANLPARLPTCVAAECNVRGLRVGIANRTFEWEIHPIRPLRFAYVYGMDITDRLHAEEQSRLHLEELARVSRLSTMGEMASGLAHELNQPLAAIRNYVSGSLLRLERGETVSVAAALKSAGDQAERAARIIQRLRDMVRKRAPIRREVQLDSLVAAVVEMTAYESRRYSVEVTVDIDPTLPRVWVDPIQIEQVLLNLVRNAIEALHSHSENPRRIAIFSRRLDGDVVLTVEDNGSGVSLDPPGRVFDPFFTTKQDGMGMGLPISRTIVENHGGHLWAENKPDGGSRFSFHLPIEREDEDDQ